MPTIVWFQNDLRLADHEPLNLAADDEVLPVFVWHPEEHGDWAPGAAQRVWLHRSLSALAEELTARGAPLVLLAEPSEDAIPRLAESCGVDRVVFYERFEPALIRRDRAVQETLESDGVSVHRFNPLLHDPAAIRTTAGDPYRVFTPFWKKLKAEMAVDDPIAAPERLQGVAGAPDGVPLDDLHLLPDVDWAGGIRQTWTPGETGALRRLEAFGAEGAGAYESVRNRPDLHETSRLSPHLRFGEVSPRQVWHRLRSESEHPDDIEPYLRQIAWREFSYHLLRHYPETIDTPMYEKFEAFPWRSSDADLRAWQRGRTGYPIVDAGMRQLWETGWMHNRVRMIVASFLTKHLLIPWQEGAAWFWDTLVDGDLANNTMGWQWSAGSGADAQPYFRVFNPITQAERYDPDGDYVRHWVPELAGLKAPHIHAPWAADPEILTEADLTLGDAYPRPIIEHADGRERALEAYETVKQAS